MKVIELFAGIGSQTQALKNLGIEHTSKISEIDKFAIKSYNAIHGETENLGDICKIEKLPYADLVIHSSPCFVKGTMVLTYDGYKNIENIERGDLVLTHNNRYREVIKPMINKTNGVYKLATMCSDDLLVTKEHPFYVRERYKVWNNDRRSYDRKFKDPEWREVKNLTKNYYVGVAINQESKIPEWGGTTFNWSNGHKSRHSNILVNKFNMYEFWWLIGRYLGDGWIKKNAGIIICCSFNEPQEIIEKLEALDFNYCIVKERTVYKIYISFKEIGEYVEQFGRGAKNKRLTGDILNLPKHLLEGFIDGYHSADGCVESNRHTHKITSTSKELLYGIGQCVAKVYNRPFSLYKTIRPKTCTIEGRTVNQNHTYQLVWKMEKHKQDRAFYEDGYIWCPINSIEFQEFNAEVYNFEVSEDNSYVVQNIIAHNCQDYSIAGKQEGGVEGSGTRSSLMWETLRLVKTNKPKFILWENVKNVLSKKHRHNFDKYLNDLEELGYINYWEVLNSKYFGIPQNRERIFCLSIRKDVNVGYEFPIALTKGDIITYTYQKQVRKRKNICDLDELKSLLINSKKESKLTIRQIQELTKENKTLIEHWFRSDNCFSIPEEKNWFKLKEILNITTDKFDSFITEFEIVDGVYEKSNRIYGLDGICPTLATVDVPSVILYEFPQKQELKLRLKDMLEEKVDEKYYLNEKVSSSLILKNQEISYCIDTNYHNGTNIKQFQEKSRRQLIQEPLMCASRGRNPKNPSSRIAGEPTEQRLEINKNGISNTLTTVQKDNYVLEPKINMLGLLDIKGNEQIRRVYGGDGLSPTLSTMQGGNTHPKILETSRIRKLTPREVWRLMGFKDEQFEKAEKVCSNSQLYKQAGNSIVVNVLEEIFKKMIEFGYIENNEKKR